MSAALSFLPEPSTVDAPVRRPRHLHAVPDGLGHAPRATPARVPARPAAGSAAGVAVLLPPSDADRLPVRLTRRGVAVLALAVAAIAGALVWLAAASAPDAAPAGSGSAGPAVVTVHAGETLWSIAGRTAPGADPRAEVDRLRQLNHLDDANGVTLRPGQQLRTR